MPYLDSEGLSRVLMNLKAKMAPVDAEGIRYPAVFALDPQYLTASSDAQLTLAANCLLTIPNGTNYHTEQPIILGAGNLDAGSAFIVGRDYYVYVVDNGLVTPDVKLIISLNATTPSGASSVNSRNIGGFHFGKNRRSNDTLQPVNASNVECGTGWEGNVYDGILPCSVWTMQHRPKSDPEGMVYLGSGKWIDIYQASSADSGKLASKFNELPLTGTEGLNWYGFVERALASGKRLPSYAEFCAAALGSPQGINENNNNAWSATTNTARQRTGFVANAVSSIGCRDCVGNVWEWLDELISAYTAAPTTTWAWHNVLGAGNGQAHMNHAAQLIALFAGGAWSHGVFAGPRAVFCSCVPWAVHASVGARCVSDSL